MRLSLQETLNFGHGSGGGLLFYAPTAPMRVTVVTSNFTGNSAVSGRGGGLIALGFVNISCVDLNVTNNVALSGGGASIGAAGAALCYVSAL